MFKRKTILIYIILLVGLISISSVSASEMADETTGLAVYENNVDVSNDVENIATISSEIVEDSKVHELSEPNSIRIEESDDNVNNIEPISTYEVSVSDVEKYYGGPEKLTVKVTHYGSPVINGLVKIYINGQTYERRTDSSGIASLGLNLDPGKYYVSASYENEYGYSIVNIKETVNAKDITKMYRNSTQYEASFTDANGNPLRNRDVTFNINGVFYTRTTDNNGIARMNINLNPNKYILTAINPSTGQKYATTINVLPTIVDNYDLTKYYKSSSQYSVRILDAHGNPARNVAVTFNIHGKFYQRYTNEDGYAVMNINLDAGNYIITAQYNGYQRSNNIKVLPILSASDLSMDYQDGSKFRVKLVDSLGRPFANQEVMFNIHGKIYYRYTDENGIATLNINLNPGDYIITTSYNGFKISNKISVKAKEITITIPSNKIGSDFEITTKFGKYTVKIARWKGYAVGGLFIILEDSNGNYLNKKYYSVNEYFHINGAWKWTGWSHTSHTGYTYHRHDLDNSVKVQKISIRLLI